MAQVEKRLPQNVPGEFYVDSSCIDCDACRQIAPATFRDHGDQSSVYQQPRNPGELHRALMAQVACPTASIGTTVGLQIELFRSLRTRVKAGDLDGARAVQVRINETLDGMIREGVFPAAKYLVGKYAVPCGSCRRPMAALTADNRANLDALWSRLQDSIAATVAEDAARA